MFERFTDPARRVVVVAQEEARRLNHNVIGTEHILLGLLGEGNGLAGAVLREAGLSLEQVRAEVRELGGSAGDDEPAPHIPFGPRAKKVLELSLREAMQLHHNYIGTEHILLGLMREAQGTAVQILERHEVDFKRTRDAVVEEVSTLRARRLGGPLEETTSPLMMPPSYGARLERILESLDRIERRLDAYGIPPAPERPGRGPAPSPGEGTPDDEEGTGTAGA
ncbi:Clp protease N-terminal domain-containing protein [Sphaerisporangium aureirubrum]|uniref:Clp protease N-terminal domain-containing protein n=1 Tax=Sphaerisporangium aureirubrum TaxID=1544736 RepID=A0ABW1NJ07_9ACTN